MKAFRSCRSLSRLLALPVAVLTLGTSALAQSTNPPVVNLVSPTNGSVFHAPTDIPLLALVSLTPGVIVTNVEFFAGTNDLGPGVPGLLPPPQSPAGTPVNYSLNWSNVPPGTYTLTAVASASNGTSKTSNPVNITVLPPGPPVVTIVATDPIAAGPGDTGTFTIYRAGDTNLTLNVYCRIGGTASNGVDYAQISSFVLIPAGATSGTVTVSPLGNALSNSVKTVVLQLAPSPLLIPVNYSIGSPDTATVFITPPGVTNPPVSVAIVSPTNGQVFFTPTTITLLAHATSSGAPVTNVEFFDGKNDLGPGLSVVLDPPPQSPIGTPGISGLVYLLNWNNAPVGIHTLTAIASAGGISNISAPVTITVFPGPRTNLPPVVRLISPANGSVFHGPLDLPLTAYANDFDGSVTSVEFFAGSNSLGFGHRLPPPVAAAPPASPPGTPPSPIGFPTNLFFLVWSNAPAGTFALTAKATDNDGASTVSDPIKIAILSPVPPPTNRPPLVSIVATDPVAIEGTNLWVWPGETNSPPTWAAWPTAVLRPFTNCGPKTATFIVSRRGDTNGDLTIPYDLGGTASNGVDYVTLPGFVTIPSGSRHALITIVPIDDGPPDINKTVILSLDPATNTPPDYLLGVPRRAAAIILDSDGPHPTTGTLAGHGFHFTAPGPDAAWFEIDYSTDLLNWTPAVTSQVINGSIDYVDPDAATTPSRFYRAVPLAGPPAE